MSFPHPPEVKFLRYLQPHHPVNVAAAREIVQALQRFTDLFEDGDSFISWPENFNKRTQTEIEHVARSAQVTLAQLAWALSPREVEARSERGSTARESVHEVCQRVFRLLYTGKPDGLNFFGHLMDWPGTGEAFSWLCSTRS